MYTSTIAAFFQTPGMGIYGTSKAPLSTLTQALAHELAPWGIRVNCLAPGIVRTRMSRVVSSSRDMYGSD